MANEQNTSGRTETDALAKVIQDHAAPSVMQVHRGDDGQAQVLMVPNGLKVVDVTPMMDAQRGAPSRRQGTARLGDLKSFIDHTRRFADGDSVIFADVNPQQPSLTSVLDYHREGSEGAPRFGTHRGVYEFPLSDEFRAWRGVSEKWIDQRGFAALIEDRMVDLCAPESAMESTSKLVATMGTSLASPARLLELSRSLAVRVDTKVAEQRNLQSGEGQIRFEESHKDESGAPLKIPGAFLIAIPIFRGGSLYQLAARLRYKVSSGSVSWSVVLYRLDRAFADALNDACASVAQATSLPVFLGSPE